MIFITDKPNIDVLRTLVFFWSDVIESSIGVVTKRSTSSALLPFHCVMIIICVLVTSGKASIGMFLNAIKPLMTNMPTQKKVKARFLSENAIMFLIKRFMSYFF
jgi:hypothetical protein